MPIDKPVTLEDIKKEPRLQDLALVRHSRLSVMPVKPDEWKLLCKMAGSVA
jgi:predicted RNA-binding protein with PUA-like domain